MKVFLLRHYVVSNSWRRGIYAVLNVYLNEIEELVLHIFYYEYKIVETVRPFIWEKMDIDLLNKLVHDT
jgi:hypothetical protein